MERIKLVTAAVCSFLGLLAFVLIVRTIIMSQRPLPTKECKATDEDFIPLSEERLSHFQQALRFKTVSEAPHVYNTHELQRFGDFLIASKFCVSVWLLLHFIIINWVVIT